ncbi:MAG: glycosyltransferase involved in cell wall biosynthesis [Urechidicola sp.]|jgi:glycosyltransferase involved in cell wall biosynthesis
MKLPKVSIVMLSYNHSKTIKKAIEGVLMQTGDFDMEFILANDCSSDNTDEVIKELLENNNYPSWIKYKKHEDNIGMTTNFIWALSQCKGTYIALCDGDDYWTDPLKLKKQVDFLDQNEQFTFSFTRFHVQENSSQDLKDDKNGHYFKEDDTFVSFDFEKFSKGWYGGLLTIVFKASSFNVESAKKYKYFRDIHLYTELLNKGKGVCLNFFSSVYCIHEGGNYSSATLLERAKTGSKCYQELYSNNKEVNALKLKYRYFHRSYIKELIQNKDYRTAFLQALLFGLKMRDISFIKSETKRIIKNMWIGKIIKRVLKKPVNKKKKFSGSQQYWEQRYVSDKDSGPGSYGRLANFKAETLNSFVENNNIKNVIEFGCGDGNQLGLANYPNYIGFDVSLKALEICKNRFKNDKTKQFYSVDDIKISQSNAELVLSLDVLFHLIEDTVFDNYMKQLFISSTKYVIIYSSNYKKQLAAHVKCRKFTDWIDKNVEEEWKLKEKIDNKYPFDEKDPNHTSIADFYIYERK